jgi:hypothetical protein
MSGRMTAPHGQGDQMIGPGSHNSIVLQLIYLIKLREGNMFKMLPRVGGNDISERWQLNNS